MRPLGWVACWLSVAGCTPGAAVSMLLPDKEVTVGAPAKIREAKATELSLGTKERPAVVALPPVSAINARKPLVVLLHGYALPAAYLDEYLGLRELTRARGMYLLLPDSSSDSRGLSFWNATDACCDFDATHVDDVSALSRVIQEAIRALPIDETRIYLIGHSNGGFMAYRMACELSEQIAGIAVLAGSDYLNPADCQPKKPVSVLHLHGDADDVVNYNGGTVPSILGELSPFPSALASVTHWAERAECNTKPMYGTPLDLTKDEADAASRGRSAVNRADTTAETTVQNFAHCRPGIDVSLWTIHDAPHEPNFHKQAFDAVLQWLTRHTR